MIRLLILGALSLSSLDCYPLAVFIALRHMGYPVTYQQVIDVTPKGPWGYYADPSIIDPLTGGRVQVEGFYSDEISFVFQELQNNTPPILCYEDGIYHCVVVSGIDRGGLWVVDQTTERRQEGGGWWVVFNMQNQKQSP